MKLPGEACVRQAYAELENLKRLKSLLAVFVTAAAASQCGAHPLGGLSCCSHVRADWVQAEHLGPQTTPELQTVHLAEEE